MIQHQALSQEFDQQFDALFNELFLNEESIQNIEEVYQQLYYYYINPIDLNKADPEALKNLLVLNDFQINEFIKYRSEAGDLLSLYELQAIQGWELSDIKKILPFISIQAKEPLMRPTSMVLMRYERDLQKRWGYIKNEDGNKAYLGTPDKFLMQIRSAPNGKIRYGFIMEKDAGENLIVDKTTGRYGLDHYSGYIKIDRIKNFDILVGDYQLQFGQGLVYSSGFSLGKSGGNIATYQRVSSGIRPHTSSLESMFMRGIASSVHLPHGFKLTGFYSFNSHDAVLKDSVFSSFNTTGYHRTYSELNYSNTVKESHAGIVLEQKKQQFQYGIGFSHINLSKTWQPSDKAYNNRSFGGDELNTAFGFMTYRWQNITTFGEGAYLFNNGFGFVGGALMNLSSILQSGFIYRNYQPDFNSIYGNAIGEKSRNSNEEGFLWVINADFSKKLRGGIYLDKFSFPWLSYRISKPSSGYEYMLHLQYRPSKSTELNLQYKEEEKERDVKEGNLTVTAPFKKRQYKVRLNYSITDNLEMRSMIQGSFTAPDQNEGVALMQDVIYSRLGYKLIFRYALFDTEDFQNRQYVYENDVLYAFNFPALQGRGYKFYILAKYNISRRLKCWLRFSHLTYTDRDEIGNGNEAVKGSSLSEIKSQLIYQF
ncbi:MAG: hypothetical protein ACNS60_11710 [Candidatus Cyclobacteriaceae bacterium M2_1C_046]